MDGFDYAPISASGGNFMRTTLLLITVFVLSVITMIVVTGCISFSPGVNMIIGNGKVIQEERPLNATVTGAGTQSPIDLILDPDLTDRVKLEGESNILEQVDVSQNADGVLQVRFKPNVNISSIRTVKVHIPVPEGGLLQTSSTGSISAKENVSLDVDKLELTVSSTGSINIHANVKELIAVSSSTGRITVTGQAEKATISLSSTGDFNGFDCKIIDATVSLSSTGTARFTVSGNLNGSISSVGNIIYDGEPASINVSTSSVGKVKKR
jgi:hypothetical protein